MRSCAIKLAGASALRRGRVATAQPVLSAQDRGRSRRTLLRSAPLHPRRGRADALVRLLHLNAPPAALKPGHDDEAYKVLVLDAATKDVVAPLLRVSDLRKCAPRSGRAGHIQLLCGPSVGARRGSARAPTASPLRAATPPVAERGREQAGQRARALRAQARHHAAPHAGGRPAGHPGRAGRLFCARRGGRGGPHRRGRRGGAVRRAAPQLHALPDAAAAAAAGRGCAPRCGRAHVPARCSGGLRAWPGNGGRQGAGAARGLPGACRLHARQSFHSHVCTSCRRARIEAGAPRVLLRRCRSGAVPRLDACHARGLAFCAHAAGRLQCCQQWGVAGRTDPTAGGGGRPCAPAPRRPGRPDAPPPRRRQAWWPRPARSAWARCTTSTCPSSRWRPACSRWACATPTCSSTTRPRGTRRSRCAARPTPAAGAGHVLAMRAPGCLGSAWLPPVRAAHECIG